MGLSRARWRATRTHRTALAIAHLPVDDLSAAKRFYVDTLGFSVDFEASTDGKS